MQRAFAMCALLSARVRQRMRPSIRPSVRAARARAPFPPFFGPAQFTRVSQEREREREREGEKRHGVIGVSVDL